MKRLTSAAVAAVLLSVFLTACGGGDDGDTNLGGTPTPPPPPPAPSAEGVYGGTLTGSTAANFEALVLENDEFWAIYGQDSGSIFSVYGFIQGAGDSDDGSFTATSVRDYGFVPALAGSLTATYDSTAKTISGSVETTSGVVGFSGGPIEDSLYDYDEAADPDAIAGNWSALSTSGGTVSVNIAADGAVTFAEGACSGTGSIEPRISGKNVFDVSLTFGPAPCAFPGQTATGIAIVYPLSTGQTQLIAAVRNAGRTAGVAIFGIR